MLIRLANAIIDADNIDMVIAEVIGTGDDGAVIRVRLKRQWWQRRVRELQFWFPSKDAADMWMDRVEEQLGCEEQLG